MRVIAFSVLLALILTLTGCGASEGGNDEIGDITGVWKGKAGDNEMVYTFGRGSTFTYDNMGMRVEGTYELSEEDGAIAFTNKDGFVLLTFDISRKGNTLTIDGKTYKKDK